MSINNLSNEIKTLADQLQVKASELEQGVQNGEYIDAPQPVPSVTPSETAEVTPTPTASPEVTPSPSAETTPTPSPSESVVPPSPSSSGTPPDGIVVQGDLKRFSKTELVFEGPQVSEGSNPNPFLDYRLTVNITSPSGKVYKVPGFFDGDGDAANTSATSGNIWKARFNADEEGVHQFAADLVQGSKVAINDNNGTVIFSRQGSFDVQGSAEGLRGRLNYVGKNHLQFTDGTYFVKAGADSPENLLAYADFDNTPDKKTYGPHVQDWNVGDPTWQNGKGKGLIGAINYLHEQGMNAYSFLPFNVKGDGKDVWPHAATSNGALDGSGDAANRLRFDVSKLDQWNVVFEHANKLGMYHHFKLQEQENDQVQDGGNLGDERKLYYRELIARFGYLNMLNWNLGEENTNTDAQRKAFAQYIYDLDPYKHNIVVHTFPSQQDQVYNPMLGSASKLTGLSVQTGKGNVHSDTKRWIASSNAANKPWVVANDEQGDAQTGVSADADYSGNKGSKSDNRTEVRQKVLWGNLMAGGAGVEYYFGYSTGETDLTAQDFRSRESKWEDAKIALDFFNQYVPFEDMTSRDDLVDNGYCLYSNNVIVVYTFSGTTKVDLPSGTFKIDIFNPRTGQFYDGPNTSGGNNVQLPNPPNSNTQDWVYLINGEGIVTPPIPANCDYKEEGNIVTMYGVNLQPSAGSNWKKEGDAIFWDGAETFGSIGQGRVEAKIKISSPGKYRFRLYSKSGKGTSSSEHNDTWFRFADASDYYGEKNGNRIYPKGTGKSPNPNGSSLEGYFKVFVSGTKDSGNFKWQASTSDNDGHNVFVEFDQPGIYTMDMASRSSFHKISRIVLDKQHPNPQSLGNQETKCDGSDNPTPTPTPTTTTNPTPTPTVGGDGPVVTGFEFISPDPSNQKIGNVNNDQVYVKGVDLPDDLYLNFEVEVDDPSKVQKVNIKLDGAVVNDRNEGVFPYAAFGDKSGAYFGEFLLVGAYTITATVYDLSGNVSDVKSVSFDIE